MKLRLFELCNDETYHINIEFHRKYFIDMFNTLSWTEDLEFTDDQSDECLYINTLRYLSWISKVSMNKLAVLVNIDMKYLIHVRGRTENTGTAN